MKVLIVDDHDLIRKGIRLLLEGFSDVEVVGEASNGCDAITLALKHHPDVILLDLSMPTGLDGFTTAKTIMDELEDVKIIVLTMHDEEIYVQKAIQYNIHGYLLKTAKQMICTKHCKPYITASDFTVPIFLRNGLKNVCGKRAEVTTY